MEERRWFSLVNIPLQGGLITVVSGAIIFSSFPLGAYIIFLLNVFFNRLYEFLPSPALVSHVQKSFMLMGYLVVGTYLITVAVFVLLIMWISNRIAGPIYRISRELDRMAQTGEIDTVDVREEDFFEDLVVSLNGLLRQVEHTERDEDSGHPSRQDSDH